MNGNFNKCFSILINSDHEGTYSSNPADPGGETMFGITERVARAHGYTGPMKDLPLETAKTIAKVEYWDAVRGDEVPDEIDFQLLDGAYNSSPTASIRWLQKSLGFKEGDVDGHFGGATMAALMSVPDIDKVVMRYDAYRLMFLSSLKIWPSFGKGWTRRIASNLLLAAGTQ